MEQTRDDAVHKIPYNKNALAESAENFSRPYWFNLILSIIDLDTGLRY